MKALIFSLNEVGRADTAVAGGKGANLGEMLQASIPVPPGFVVTAHAFERFLQETDLDVEVAAMLDRVKYKDTNSVERASESLRALFRRAKMPKDIGTAILAEQKVLKAPLVAVRSSATVEDGSQAS